MGDPEILYHYTDGAGLQGIFTSGELWATKITYQNDEEEAKFAFKLAERILGAEFHRRSSPSLLRERVLGLLSSNRESAGANVFVFSLSEKPDDLSQWRGYSRPGDGYCLGFRVDALRQLEDGDWWSLTKCLYKAVDQDALLRPPLVAILDAYDAKTVALGPHPDAEAATAAAVYSFVVMNAPKLKHHSFKDEAEWRLHSGPISGLDERVSLRPGRFYLRPFFKIDWTRATNPIQEIHVGPGPHSGLAMSSVNMLISKFRAAGVEVVYPSRVPYRES